MTSIKHRKPTERELAKTLINPHAAIPPPMEALESSVGFDFFPLGKPAKERKPRRWGWAGIRFQVKGFIGPCCGCWGGGGVFVRGGVGVDSKLDLLSARQLGTECNQTFAII